jgi:cytochrome c oxidase assembly factor CtaG
VVYALLTSAGLLSCMPSGRVTGRPGAGGSVAGMGTALASGHPIAAVASANLVHAVASGYHGPPELTVPRAFTEWTFDPWMTALVVVLGGAYLAGSRRAGDWPVARRIWFLGLGLGFLVIATMSWVGAYSPVLFYARAVQTVLLVLMVPLFLALGRPVTLAGRVFPRAGSRIEAVIRSRPARILTFPAITTLALVGVPFVMYFTTWYTHVFHSGTVRELTYLALMTPGYLFFWTLLRVDPVPKEYPYAVSMWITGAEVIGDAFFGIAVIADQNLLGAAYYHSLALPWGPSLATDQVLGGGVLWILGDLVGLPFLAAQLIHLMREDESEAIRIDAELDAQQAQLAAARQPAAQQVPTNAGGQSATHLGPDPSAASATATTYATQRVSEDEQDPNDGDEPQGSQPWWETDPRFTSRFKPTS